MVPGIPRVAVLVCSVLVAVACDGGRTGGDGSIDAIEDDGVPDEVGDADEDGCTETTVCVPFEPGCDDEGEPVRCAATGDVREPREPCAPGQACDPETGWCACGPCEVLVDGACERAGPVCGPDWRDDGACGCAPVVDECGSDAIPVIGGGCAGVGIRDECGSGTWGLIPTDGSTVFVDGSYAGSDADGSEARPYPTLQQAIDSVPAGATAPVLVAVAAGTYAEDVVVDRAARVVGRCPSMVTIVPTPGEVFGPYLGDADGASLESVTVDGGGLVRFGVTVRDCPRAALADVAVTGFSDVGILVENSAVEVTACSVADVDPARARPYGYGIQASPGPAGTRCDIDVDAALVERTGRFGVLLYDCAASVRASRVATTGAAGIQIQGEALTVDAYVDGNVIEQVPGGGIVLADSALVGDLRVEGNIVSGILAPDTGPATGIGCWAAGASLHLADNLVEDVAGVGITVADASAVTLEGGRVARAASWGVSLGDVAGGIAVEGITVRDATTVGILVTGSAPVDVTSSSVTDVTPGASGTARGIALQDVGGVSVVGNALALEAPDVSIVSASGPVAIRHNLLEGDGISVALVEGEDEVSIDGNRIRGGSAGIFVMDVASAPVRIRDNAIGPIGRVYATSAGSWAQGITTERVDDVSIVGNALDLAIGDAAWVFGIASMHASRVAILDDEVRGASTAGIFVRPYTSDPTMEIGGCTVTGGAGSGIYVDWESTSAATLLVEDCRVSGIHAPSWEDSLTYGDGIVLVDATAADLGDCRVRSTSVTGSARAGIFSSGVHLSLFSSDLWSNTVSVAWQDGGGLYPGDIRVWCNGSDQPWTDSGLPVPDAPDVGLPGT